MASLVKLVRVTETPMCATCQHGKQVRRTPGVKRVPTDKAGGIQQDKLEPGDEVAVDQFEVKKRGRRSNTTGKEKDTEKFSGGTIFADVATGFTKAHFQVSLGAEETIQGKIAFERECHSFGASVKRCRTDNGTFTSRDFMDEIQKQDQHITVSGVGAHHQNGIAERSIRTVVTKARTMLLHAMLRWPDETTADLWPLAMKHASDLNNITPKINDGLSPEEKFARSVHGTDRLQNLPVWGCPVCVLQPTLQDGKKLPKWKPRSRRGQFVGWSPLHASNVAWVRDLRTGHTSPQFHVVFDNWFETIAQDDEDETVPEWDVVVTSSRFMANVDPEDLEGYELDDEWSSKEELTARRLENETEETTLDKDQGKFPEEEETVTASDADNTEPSHPMCKSQVERNHKFPKLLKLGELKPGESSHQEHRLHDVNEEDRDLASPMSKRSLYRILKGRVHLEKYQSPLCAIE